MLDSDKKQFAQLMHTMADLYGKPRLSKEALAMMWGDLVDYQIADVELATNLHRKDSERGRFMPTVSDVVYQIYELQRRLDGFISDEEAWMVALRASDESASVMVTSEILEALAFVEPSLRVGDRVAARVAFKNRYNEIIHQRRVDRQIAKPFNSGGVSRAAVRHNDCLPAPTTEAGLVSIAGPVADAVAESARMLPKDRQKYLIGEMKAVLSGDR